MEELNIQQLSLLEINSVNFDSIQFKYNNSLYKIVSDRNKLELIVPSGEVISSIEEISLQSLLKKAFNEYSKEYFVRRLTMNFPIRSLYSEEYDRLKKSVETYINLIKSCFEKIELGKRYRASLELKFVEINSNSC